MMPRDRSPSPQRPAKYAKYAKVAEATTRQHLLEGGALQFDPRMEVCVGLQFKVKHANHDWGGLWEVENVERRVAGLTATKQKTRNVRAKASLLSVLKPVASGAGAQLPARPSGAHTSIAIYRCEVADCGTRPTNSDQKKAQE